MPVSVTGAGAFTGATTINGLSLPSDAISPGMVLINKTDFSSASTVSINNCFTSTYENYKVYIIGTSNQASWQNARLRLRLNGVDNSSAIYFDRRTILNGTTFTSDGNNTATSGLFGYWTNSSNNGTFDLNIFRASAQMVLGGSYSAYTGSANGVGQSAIITAGGNAFDGITIYPETGTVSGTIRIYGLRNA